MINGFEKIVEERILSAQKSGHFDKLQNAGQPLNLNDDSHIREELRLAYKILKNAGFVPSEIQLRKEIEQTEELLSGMKDYAEKYKIIKKLNFLIMKLNSIWGISAEYEIPQHYSEKIVNRLEKVV